MRVCLIHSIIQTLRLENLVGANLSFFSPPSYVDFVSTFYDIHFSFECVSLRMLQKAEETLDHSK